MDACDALIVGGGPAGSSCAARLRRAGLDVVVMDRRAFPRDKVCAGWITPQVVAAACLPLDEYAAEHVLQPITGFRLGVFGESAATEVRYEQTVSYGILRREFDDYLLKRSGARLRLGEPAEKFERRDGMWTVGDAIQTPLLIGAGGHFCPVARHLGTRKQTAAPLVTAQEIEFPLNDADQRSVAVERETPELYFRPDMKGYGWCFRKGGYLNIGLGLVDAPPSTSRLESFIEFLRTERRVTCDVPRHFHGHAYQLYDRAVPSLMDDGVMLIGDAAGLAYPESGEGIRPAVESGLLAAEVAAAAEGDYRRERLQPYVDQIVERFGRPPAHRWTDYLPQALILSLARRLLLSSWTARHIVLDRWFLHCAQPAMSASQDRFAAASSSVPGDSHDVS